MHKPSSKVAQKKVKNKKTITRKSAIELRVGAQRQEKTQNTSKHTLHERLRGKGEHPELAHAARHDSERKGKDGRGEFDGGECARDEVEEPPEGAERDEAVEVPRGVVI